MTPYVVFNGATGGLGRHLGGALADAGASAWPLSSRLGDAAGLGSQLDLLPIAPGSALTFIQGAGMVAVGEAEQNPAQAFDINVTRTETTAQALIEWAHDNGVMPRIMFVSSSHVYAPPEPGHRLTESSPTHPRSVYATTKLDGETRMRVLADDHGADLTIARVFGAIGPDQRAHYLLPGLIRRVRAGDLARVPGLDYVRDYLDTRDVSRHLAALALAAGDGVTVNICSGEPIRIGDLLDQVLEIHHQADPGALERARQVVSAAPGRPTDVAWSVGDPTLLGQLVPGPIRAIPIARTVTDALANESA